MLKVINMIYRQQRAPVATTSDFFRAQSNPAQRPSNLQGPSEAPAVLQDSPLHLRQAASFLQPLGFGSCFSSALLWGCLPQLLSVVILTHTVAVPTLTACALSPLATLPSLLQVPLPQVEGAPSEIHLPACPTPCGTSPGMCLPHDPHSRASTTPPHPPQWLTPGTWEVMATMTLIS